MADARGRAAKATSHEPKGAQFESRRGKSREALGPKAAEAVAQLEGPDDA
jgi:hypothetical protein